MKYSFNHIYVIVEDYFNLPNSYLLAECVADESEALKANLELKQFLGKGVSIHLCLLLGPVDHGIEDEGGEIVLRENGSGYGFQGIEVLGDYPRIEGELTPGIYADDHLGSHYELKLLDDLSELYADYGESGLTCGQFKIICRKDEFEIFEIENGAEILLETIGVHPFTYFDVNCPICLKRVVTYELLEHDPLRCGIVEDKCVHYVGRVENYRGKYLAESLEGLKIDYKIQDEELFLLTAIGWQNPKVYTLSVDPVNSHWSVLTDEDYTNVFLFLETIEAV